MGEKKVDDRGLRERRFAAPAEAAYTARSLKCSALPMNRVIDDASAAGSLALHDKELEILNLIYCNVMNTAELLGYLP